MTDTPTGTPTLFWLAFNSSQVMMSKDMKTATMLARTGTAPDGVAVDVSAGKVFWTNMGSALGTGGGTVQSANLDGSMVTTIIPAGVGTTFKQTTLDWKNKKLYWGDREGRKLWRSDYDGKNHEAIVSAQTPEVVGCVVDSDAGKVYFTDRTGGKIWRTNIEMPAGATAETRTDLEMVLMGPPGSNTIDLEIDHTNKVLYWTDRTLGTVHSMQLDKPDTDKVIVPNLSEPIGICLDVPNGKIYFAELGGSISSAGLDGSGVERGILRSSGATGCVVAYIP
jgi:DNA-binding beta-propeller fold protein YncE